MASAMLQLVFMIGLPLLFLMVMYFQTTHGAFWKPFIGTLFLRKTILRETMDAKSLFTLMNFKEQCDTTQKVNRAARRLQSHLRQKSWFVRKDIRIFEQLYGEEYARVRRLEEQEEAREYARAKARAKARQKEKASSHETQVAAWRIILAVPKNVSDASIVKKHYRKLAMQHHPDRGGKVEEMAKINRAYEMARKELSF